jgi:hypothetical protein
VSLLVNETNYYIPGELAAVVNKAMQLQFSIVTGTRRNNSNYDNMEYTDNPKHVPLYLIYSVANDNNVLRTFLTFLAPHNPLHGVGA